MNYTFQWGERLKKSSMGRKNSSNEFKLRKNYYLHPLSKRIKIHIQYFITNVWNSCFVISSNFIHFSQLDTMIIDDNKKNELLHVT